MRSFNGFLVEWTYGILGQTWMHCILKWKIFIKWYWEVVEQNHLLNRNTLLQNVCKKSITYVSDFSSVHISIIHAVIASVKYCKICFCKRFLINLLQVLCNFCCCSLIDCDNLIFLILCFWLLFYLIVFVNFAKKILRWINHLKLQNVN